MTASSVKLNIECFVSVREKTLNKMLVKLRRLEKQIKVLIDVYEEDRDIEQIVELQDQMGVLKIEINAMSQILRSLYGLK